MLATGNTGEIGRGFGKNAGKWTGRVEISKKKSLAVSVACMAIYLPTPGFKGRMFKNSHKMGLKFLCPQLPTAGYSTSRKALHIKI